jgi:hypothetical protein
MSCHFAAFQPLRLVLAEKQSLCVVCADDVDVERKTAQNGQVREPMVAAVAVSCLGDDDVKFAV